MQNIAATASDKRFRIVIPDETTALDLLANVKWENGYVCSKCGGINYCKGKSYLSRRCTKCKKEESVTANTIFHRCKIPINISMEIAYLVCNVAAISSYEISRQLNLRHMTCYGFQKKVIDCLGGGNDDKLLKRVLTNIQKEIDATL